MRQRSGHDAEMADYRVRQAVATRPSARHGDVLLAAGDSAGGPLDPLNDTRPATYHYSSVEERWDIRLQPDGSAHASVVVRREQQIGTGQRWRFVARRGLPGMAWRRTRLWIAAAGAAVAALVAGGWLAWSAGPRPAPNPQTVTIAMPPPMVMMTPPPVTVPPSAPRATPPHAVPPALVQAETPRVPVVLPPPTERDKAASAAPDATDTRPLDRRPAVQAAMARAFASGEPEAWTEGDLSGFVVVGPAAVANNANCRNTVVLVRGGQAGDRTISHRRCQAAGGAISVRDGA